MIHSDWHIHSENSYDASLKIEDIVAGAKKHGIGVIGITDHANFNDRKFMGDIRNSVAAVKEAQKKYPFIVQGVELTPIEKPEFDYIAIHGTREGYIPPLWDRPYDIELAATKEELMALGVRYAVGAAHWRIDKKRTDEMAYNLEECIREWYRQQMYLACDERVTILGHPWYNGRALWYEDFSVIPRSMNMDIAAAVKENGKYVECNSHFFGSKTAEKFKRQYAEFLRELFEMGIPVTYGSDSHHEYKDKSIVEKYLSYAGFKDGDLSQLSEEMFWKV